MAKKRTSDGPELTVPLHDAQDRFCMSSALYRGFVGGRGAGKTWVGAFDLICRAREGRTYLAVSPTGVLMQDNTLPTFTALARQLGVWQSIRVSPWPNVTIAPGAVIRFRSAEDPDRMRGPNLTGCWLDEASIMKQEAYSVAIAALREKGEQGWLSATFTPKGRSHWTYQTFATGRPNTALIHAPTRANPFLPPSFADTLRDQYTGLLADQELEGLFVEIEGAEWPSTYFPDDLWFVDWPGDLDHRVMALDPSKGKDAKAGDYSAIVKLGRCRQGLLWVDADLARRPTSQIVGDSIDQARRFRPDLFAVEVNAFQELLADDIAEQSTATGTMLPLVPVDNRVNKLVRIRRLGPLLARKRLRFRDTPGGRLLVQQLREFPEGSHDDGPDALEMAVRTLGDLLAGGADDETTFDVARA